MTWFINQSLLFIVIAFLLGLLVGYLWWGRQVRRIRTQETTTPAPHGRWSPREPLVADGTAEPVKDEAETRGRVRRPSRCRPSPRPRGPVVDDAGAGRGR